MKFVGAAVLGLATLGSPGAESGGDARPRQDWMLHCQGCHGADGSLERPDMPALRGRVATYVGTAEGRAWLVQVPGVASASLSDARLAETLNWMLAAFDAEHMPDDFEAFTGEEVGALRTPPLVERAAQAQGRLHAAGHRDTRTPSDRETEEGRQP